MRRGSVAWLPVLALACLGAGGLAKQAPPASWQSLKRAFQTQGAAAGWAAGAVLEPLSGTGGKPSPSLVADDIVGNRSVCAPVPAGWLASRQRRRSNSSASLMPPGADRGRSACALGYHWDSAQLLTALSAAAVHGLPSVVVAGDTLWSNSPLGAPTSGSNVLGDAAFGNGSAYVVSMWWQGPTARVSAFGLFSMGSSEVEVIMASSCWSSLACLLVGVDQRNSRAHVAARVNGSAIKSPGTVLSAFGHAASSLRLEKSYLRSWHHVVMAVLPHNLDAGSMRVWIDGVTLEQTCTRRTGLGFVETPLGLSEPFLPSAAREGCNFAMAITEPPLKADNISRLPPSFSDGRLVWGTRASLSPTGRVTRSGSGGSASTLGFYLSDRPFTLANRLVLAHTAPAAALADAMPTWAPGVLFACRLADTSNFALAGRTVCQATCADPGDVLAVDLHAALCGTPSDPASRAAQWLQGSVDDAAGLCKLADTAAGQDALQRGVWAAGDGVASWLALPVSWASPIGWAGVIGAAGRTDDLPWTREGLERWAQFAPWKDAGLGRPAHRGRSGLPVARPAAVRPLPGSGWPDAFGFRHGQSAGPPTGQSLACRPAPTEVSLRRAVPQSMVVQACLGGLSLDPAFRHAESALSDRLALDHLLLQLHQDVVTLAGLNNATGSRAIISREGIVTAEHALQVRETVVGFDPSLTADALCKSPSRDALIGAYGQGVTSSCLCTHIGIAAAPVHPEAASSSSRRDAAGTAPWAEAGSPAMSTAAFAAAALASSLRFAPTLSTPLTVLAAVSPASVTVFPVYTCGSETRREAGERAAGADPSIVLLLRSITDGLVSGWAPPFPTGAPFHAASAPSLVVCGDLKQETLMWLTLPVAAAVAAYVALSLSYCAAHGSVWESVERRQRGGALLLQPMGGASSGAGGGDGVRDGAGCAGTPVQTAGSPRRALQPAGSPSRLQRARGSGGGGGLRRRDGGAVTPLAGTATTRPPGGCSLAALWSVGVVLPAAACCWCCGHRCAARGLITPAANPSTATLGRSALRSGWRVPDGTMLEGSIQVSSLSSQSQLRAPTPSSAVPTSHEEGGSTDRTIGGAGTWQETVSVARVTRGAAGSPAVSPCGAVSLPTFDPAQHTWGRRAGGAARAAGTAEPESGSCGVAAAGPGHFSLESQSEGSWSGDSGSEAGSQSGEPGSGGGDGGRGGAVGLRSGGGQDQFAGDKQPPHGLAPAAPGSASRATEGETRGAAEAAVGATAAESVGGGRCGACCFGCAAADREHAGSAPHARLSDVVGCLGSALVLVGQLAAIASVIVLGRPGTAALLLIGVLMPLLCRTGAVMAGRCCSAPSLDGCCRCWLCAGSSPGLAIAASLVAADGGVLGWRFVRERKARSSVVALTLLLSIVDLRSARLLLSGLCSGGSSMGMTADARFKLRRRLAAAECCIAAPWLALTGVACVVALWDVNGAACAALSEASLWALYGSGPSCMEVWLCATTGCATRGGGLWAAGLPLLWAAAWSLAAAWWRVGGAVAALRPRGALARAAWAETPSSQRRIFCD